MTKKGYGASRRSNENHRSWRAEKRARTKKSPPKGKPANKSRRGSGDSLGADESQDTRNCDERKGKVEKTRGLPRLITPIVRERKIQLTSVGRRGGKREANHPPFGKKKTEKKIV